MVLADRPRVDGYMVQSKLSATDRLNRTDTYAAVPFGRAMVGVAHETSTEFYAGIF